MTGSASYDPILVALSIVIAIGASYTALDLAQRVTSTRGTLRRWWLFGGGATMGMGIWSMHFTGMLAYQMPVPMTYDLAITGLSMGLAIGASWAALYLVSRPTLSLATLWAGACLMGLGIISMHYIGMAAMRMPCVLSYDPALFALSIAVAVGASFMALKMAFLLRSELTAGWSRQKLASAMFMGVAIAGMHYIGMAAANISPLTCQPATWPAVNISQLGGAAIGSGTLIILAIALLSSYRERLQLEQDLLKDRFLGVLSHELRTPLNAVLGFGSALEDGLAGPLTEQQRYYIHKMNEGAQNMLGLVEDLLDMSRLQAGKFSLTREPCAIAPIVEDVMSTLAPLAEQKRIRLATDMPPDLPELVADPQRVRQVLINLVTNGIKFTEPGGAVEVRVRPQGEAVRFEVSDNGIGIAEKDYAKLFTPFTQLDMSNTRKAGGTGLGLSITKAIVEEHGGRIGVKSMLGQGSTFWFELPLNGKG